MGSFSYVEDPNKVNTNQFLPNSVPDYENMFIFVELYAESRNRSVIINGNTSSDKGFKVNLMGFNQNNNINEYTTDYHYTSDDIKHNYGNTEIKQYEGFGIEGIKIKVNSSFVPQVNIRFIDVRGNAFFNQEDSPYRILFDFPPPIFTLRVKGYYGKTTSYKLHLVNYTSEFNSNNGDYVIDANFVAMTFAPLSDVLFRYVVNVGMLNNPLNNSSDLKTEPKNTYELLQKLNNLYSAVKETNEADQENQDYKSSILKLSEIDRILYYINTYKTDQKLKSCGNPYLCYVDKTDSNNIKIQKINSLSDYNTDLLDNDKISLNILYVNGYPNTENDKENPYSTIINDVLNIFKINLINEIKSIKLNFTIDNRDIFVDNSLITDYDILTDKAIRTKYIGLNIDGIYDKLFKEKNSLIEYKSGLSKKIESKINGLILERLGMMPTIYNIFKIILNDVDNFFSILKYTSELAENQHNSDKDKLIKNSQYGDNKDNIYAFPLIINSTTLNGVNKTERIAPIELNDKYGINFPELKLVRDFIDTFKDQQKFNELYNFKTQTDDNNINKWIPLSPVDSVFSSSDLTNPYLNNNNIDLIFKILVDRYLVLSQNIFANSFINNDDKNAKALINLFTNSEPANIIAAISDNDKLINSLKTNIIKYKSNINNFYNDLGTSINQEYIVISNNKIYSNKNNVGFIGLNIFNDDNIEIVNTDSENASINPVDVYKKDMKKEWYKIFTNDDPINFTKENVLYYNDYGAENASDSLVIDDVCLKSIYICNLYDINKKINSFTNIDQYFASGNTLLKLNNPNPRKLTSDGGVFSEIWSYFLSYYDTEIVNHFDILNTKSKSSALLFLSNFGYTMSPFNKYPFYLNDLIFNHPSIIEVPSFLPIYLGALISVYNDQDEYNKIYSFFNNFKSVNNNNGYFIFADFFDVINNLSYNDKLLFEEKFDEFFENPYDGYNKLWNGFVNMYNEVNDIYTSQNDKKLVYQRMLVKNSNNNDSGKYFDSITLPLMRKTNIANFSELTFNITTESYNEMFLSIDEIKLLQESDKEYKLKERTNKYFIDFFAKLDKAISDYGSDKKSQSEDKLQEIKDDPDLINQTYYSFKNINDKWLSNSKSKGYPFIDSKLIDAFSFVDRTLNPIDDTIINAEILVQLFDDPSASVYTVLSQLLSANGFEFFPLQNFMNISNGKWEECFKINSDYTDDSSSTSFVCMYIGGSASYPTNANNGFVNDGVDDINTLSELSQYDNSNNDTDSNEKNNFYYKQVRAFAVKFGDQNQSMFSDIKIDSKSYSETNESIQILSRLANDNKSNIPTPKAQNLYNIYENRSYSATVTSLGNISIQPTQYFQLENIPMFNGAYIILDVEHIIENNYMTTKFTGNKILRYPIPRVTSPAVYTGFNDGSSSNQNNNNTNTAYDMYPDKRMEYNSMYTKKIE